MAKQTNLILVHENDHSSGYQRQEKDQHADEELENKIPSIKCGKPECEEERQEMSNYQSETVDNL